MMKNFVFFIIVMFLMGCSYSKPLDVPGLDYKAFKSDKGGCNNVRISLLPTITDRKDDFLGISENEILKALGRFDYQVLETRTEKAFVYFLEPGPQCEDMQAETRAESLVLYFNGIRLVKEVVIRKGGHIPDM